LDLLHDRGAVQRLVGEREEDVEAVEREGGVGHGSSDHDYEYSVV
jgi:hypothetical protein